MNKRSGYVAVLVGLAILVSADDSRAQRIDNSGLQASAKRFRDAVVDFEKVVRSVRGIERAEERIVDRFEEQNKRVINAVKNPRLGTRLRTEYSRMLTLQAQAQQAIFGQYTPNQKLVAAWQQVEWCQFYFEQQYAFFVANPRGCRVERLRGPLVDRQTSISPMANPMINPTISPTIGNQIPPTPFVVPVIKP